MFKQMSKGQKQQHKMRQSKKELMRRKEKSQRKSRGEFCDKEPKGVEVCLQKLLLLFPCTELFNVYFHLMNVSLTLRIPIGSKYTNLSKSPGALSTLNFCIFLNINI